MRHVWLGGGVAAIGGEDGVHMCMALVAMFGLSDRKIRGRLYWLEDGCQVSTASGMRWILADGLSVGAAVGGRTEVICPLRWWRLGLCVLCGYAPVLCSSLVIAACRMR